MLTNQVKQDVLEAVKAYMSDQKLGLAEMNKLSGVNQSYISQMLAGKETASSTGGKEVAIADKYYIMLAQVVGVDVQKTYWKTIVTKQMRQIITGLEVAKKQGTMATIICETGLGKTYCKDLFYQQNPKHTYVVTINSLVRLHDVVNMLMEEVGIPIKGSKALRLANLIMKLREIKRSGGNPVIIFDEAENMEHQLLKMIKGLFDGISGYASIVLIGTSQLETKMLKAKNQNMEGGPQFYRRFKASLKRVNSVPNFQPFFDEFVGDNKLRKVLTQVCDNYGELQSYLEPLMREADMRERELNIEFFREVYPDVAA